MHTQAGCIHKTQLANYQEKATTKLYNENIQSQNKTSYKIKQVWKQRPI